jgi:hypothetical protein
LLKEMAELGERPDLPRGEWLAMIASDLPFKARTAQRLMAVARNRELVNAAHASHLPPSWMTLYELTKLPEPELHAAIADGWR